MTVNIGSPMCRTLLGNCVREGQAQDERASTEEVGEMEIAETEEDASTSNQRADNGRKDYTKKCRDVTTVTIGHLALDVDTCGKSSADIAAGIKKSTQDLSYVAPF